MRVAYCSFLSIILKREGRPPYSLVMGSSVGTSGRRD